jgi:hypothetical protein
MQMKEIHPMQLTSKDSASIILLAQENSKRNRFTVLLDSGAETHVTGCPALLENVRSLKKGDWMFDRNPHAPGIIGVKGEVIPAVGIGDTRGKLRDITLVPGMVPVTLISTSLLMKQANANILHDRKLEQVFLVDESNAKLLIATMTSNGLFEMEESYVHGKQSGDDEHSLNSKDCSSEPLTFYNSTPLEKLKSIHEALNHRAVTSLYRMAQRGELEQHGWKANDIPFSEIQRFFCEHCSVAKAKRAKIRKSNVEKQRLLTNIRSGVEEHLHIGKRLHSDTAGPLRTAGVEKGEIYAQIGIRTHGTRRHLPKCRLGSQTTAVSGGEFQASY